jgi:hypothetical protein
VLCIAITYEDFMSDYTDVERSADPFRAALPAYATALALGGAADAPDPSVASHLAACPDCAAELHELLELVQPAYAGTLAPAARSPAANLTFLEVPMQHLPQATLPWRLDAGRLAIQFSDALLSSIRQPRLAGAARAGRGQLIFRYIQEPSSLHDLDVSIEVYAEGASQQHGRVRVGVDVPSRSPLEQSGNLVTLYLGNANWEAETDETGCVDFVPVPLEDLASLRVEITPLRELEN